MSIPMQQDQSSQGLVLKSLDFRDRQRIITLFTPYQGIISLIVKGITRKRPHLIALTTPLLLAEYHYRTGKSDLYTFLDGTPLNTHSQLRTSLPHLEAAGLITRALLKSQLPGKPAPDLFHLTLAYLQHLPQAPHPATYAASFLLKLLKHEGILEKATDLSEIRSFQELNTLQIKEGLEQEIFADVIEKVK